MKGDHVFKYAQRALEDPPDEPDHPIPPLPPPGFCPYCRQALIIVEGATECPTILTDKPCDYDGFLTEAENRKRFQEEPWKPEL